MWPNDGELQQGLPVIIISKTGNPLETVAGFPFSPYTIYIQFPLHWQLARGSRVRLEPPSRFPRHSRSNLSSAVAHSSPEQVSPWSRAKIVSLVLALSGQVSMDS